MTARRPLRLVVALLVLAATSACVRLPEDGPIVAAGQQGTERSSGEVAYVPKPPQEGDPAAAIVEGFLRAMRATPVSTTVARQFLTGEAQTSWDPEQQLVIFSDRQALVSGGEDTVSVDLSTVQWVDSRGGWRGRLGDGSLTLDFPLVRENDEWRISSVRNALVVPETWFQENYVQASVYFFDPTASILVAEPVFVPSGEQLASGLIQAMLAGPGPRLDTVSRSFLPSGLTLGLSVPVSDAGVADITLKGDAGQLTDQAAQLTIAQVAWTLKQDPSVRAFRLTIGDQAVTVRGQSQFSVNLASEFDPTDYQSSPSLFALHDGVLESGDGDSLGPVAGRFGTTAFGIRSVGISLTGGQAAAVSSSGASVFLGPVSTDGGVDTILSGATDLLRPAWDFADRMWLVDRTLAGARVSYVDDGAGSAKALTVPGLTGADVRRFLVSRDGTRLVAVLRGKRSDRLVVSRIRHDSQGRVVGATHVREMAWSGGDIQRIRDIGWRTPTSVAVLHLLTTSVSQVVTIPVDGSPAGSQDLTQQQSARALVASPASGETLYTLSGAGLYDLTGAEGGNLPLPPGVTSVQYVG